MRSGALATLGLGAIWIACSSPTPPVPPPLAPSEIAFRQKLGIPADAQRVVVFGQSSHLDIDWQKTFDDYYAAWVEQVFLSARQLMDAQPRAFYSVAEMAFLKHHTEVHPEEVAALKADVARGALRIVGGGMTSPDTLLPETELLARDFLFGIRFAEDTLGAHPHVAWLPDSFGHSGTAPDVLAAAGYDSVAFARIDGAPTIFESLFHKMSAVPKPGSTAEMLLAMHTADFFWKGQGGAQLFAHYLAGSGLYCEGENIDYQESIPNPGGHTGAFDADPTFTDGRIDGYIGEMMPYASTPYMFVPVGCDFEAPKSGLIAYLDGYNQRRYPITHVWAVAAPFDDFASLVLFHKDRLPILQQELSPYFMGFYGSRADVKRGVRDAAAPFFVAETFATALGDDGKALTLAAEPALEKLTRADHHDFVTGTAANSVVTGEQMPLVAEAQAAGQAELAQVAAAIAKRIPLTPTATARVMAFNASGLMRSDVANVVLPLAGNAVPQVHASFGGADVPMELAFAPTPADATATFHLALASVPSFGWRAIDFLPGGATVPAPAVSLVVTNSSVVLSNAHVRAEWDKQNGMFALVSVAIDSQEALAGPSMTPVDYHDTGGLWRLGNEMAGCELSPLPAVPDTDTVQVMESGALGVRVAFVSASGMTREASLGAGATGLSLAITTGAADTTTRTVAFSFATPKDAVMHTSSAGGFMTRPYERVYTPTFWSAVGWVEIGGWAVLLRQSTGARMSTPGSLELMAARRAQVEQCDVEGLTGDDPGLHRIEWRIERVANVAVAEAAAQAFDRPLTIVVTPTDQSAMTDLAPEVSLLSVTGAGIVSALKPATRGNGIVLRALPMPGPMTVQLGVPFGAKQATQIDLAERDGTSLGTASSFTFDRATQSAIMSIRLQ